MADDGDAWAAASFPKDVDQRFCDPNGDWTRGASSKGQASYISTNESWGSSCGKGGGDMAGKGKSVAPQPAGLAGKGGALWGSPPPPSFGKDGAGCFDFKGKDAGSCGKSGKLDAYKGAAPGLAGPGKGSLPTAWDDEPPTAPPRPVPSATPEASAAWGPWEDEDASISGKANSLGGSVRSGGGQASSQLGDQLHASSLQGPGMADAAQPFQHPAAAAVLQDPASAIPAASKTVAPGVPHRDFRPSSTAGSTPTPTGKENCDGGFRNAESSSVMSRHSSASAFQELKRPIIPSSSFTESSSLRKLRDRNFDGWWANLQQKLFVPPPGSFEVVVKPSFTASPTGAAGIIECRPGEVLLLLWFDAKAKKIFVYTHSRPEKMIGSLPLHAVTLASAYHFEVTLSACDRIGQTSTGTGLKLTVVPVARKAMNTPLLMVVDCAKGSAMKERNRQSSKSFTRHEVLPGDLITWVSTNKHASSSLDADAMRQRLETWDGTFPISFRVSRNIQPLLELRLLECDPSSADALPRLLQCRDEQFQKVWASGSAALSRRDPKPIPPPPPPRSKAPPHLIVGGRA
eukprot:TRINITY_DN1109_c0_g1_i1.p1 TRINITY_DN1109_c0_g1~~TRINITY_DN1109_c0_g1_i1.p1  ORF type:complete len:584 (+),score=102.56 TRINITY_DN1109_c0_g1_i1:36-1754(+)